MTPDKVVELRKVAQKYAYATTQLHETVAKKAGFAGTDHKYLGFFLQKGNLTAGELAELSGLTTGAVTGLIDRFEERKLVKRETDKNDRRRVIIVPNKQRIMSLFEPLYKEFQEETEKLIATFSDKEMEVIEDYFIKAIQLMNTTFNKLK